MSVSVIVTMIVTLSMLDCVFKYDCDGVHDYNCNSEIDLTLLAIMTVICSVTV